MYEKKPVGWKKHIDFVLLDFFLMHVSLVLGFLIRLGSGLLSLFRVYAASALLMSLAFFMVILFHEGYKNIMKRGPYAEFAALLKQTVIIALTTVLMLYLTKSAEDTSRISIVLTFILYICMSYAARLLFKNYLRSKMLSNTGDRSLIVICMEHNAEKFVERVKNTTYEMNISGIIIADKDLTGSEVAGIPVVSDLDGAAEYVCRSWVDEVFIGRETYISQREKIENFAHACSTMGITVHTMLFSLGEAGDTMFAERFAGFWVVSRSAAVVNSRDMIIKRCMDIAGGIVGCLLTVILTILVGPWIFIASPGPIFFAQQRVGRNGKPFKIYKFRSMYMDAEKRKAELMAKNKVQDGLMFKMDDDPRIIKGIGHLIRDLSIDEFPQFFNVLKGEMSLVGTRPPTMDEWEKYELHHRKRLAIKPGLTGMWQVSGRSSITDFEEIVRLDTQYIEDWSIGLDIKIIFKTILVVLKKDGAQ